MTTLTYLRRNFDFGKDSKTQTLVQNLVSKQQSYCNKIAAEVKFELDSEDNDAESQQEAISKLWKVRLGMPKNKQLMRLNEVPAIRRLLDKFDLEMNSDFNKEKRYSIKEQLFYIIDEKQQQADLNERTERSS